MTKVETKPLPNKVGTADIANAELKRVAKLLMEDIISLKQQLETAQAAVRELQRR
jgi:hypothetical protein